MPARKTAKATKARTSTEAPGDPIDLSPSDQVASEILADRADLQPSVDRILSAGLPEADELRALDLFRTALDRPGDPNRDPRSAITAVTGGSAT